MRSLTSNSSIRTLFFVGVAGAIGCSSNPPANVGGASKEGTASSEAAAEKDCVGDFAIDDGEDGDHRIGKQANRGGSWFSYADKAGTSVAPAPGDGTFTMADGGARGSKKAARISGKVGASGEKLHAGVGLSFLDPRTPYDASKYAGISFWAKAATGSATELRVRVPDANTDEAGKTCKSCGNDFGADITLGTEWKRYSIPFAKMSQSAGAADPRPTAVAADKIFGIQWEVTKPGAAYDIWIDDVQFIGCK